MLHAWRPLLCTCIFYSATIPQLPSAGRDVTMQLAESTTRRAENKPEECANVLLVNLWVLRWVSCSVLLIYVYTHKCSQLSPKTSTEHVWRVLDVNVIDRYA